MGGVSESFICFIDSGVFFFGNVFIENFGGFVFVCICNFDFLMNLFGFVGIELWVKGDGKCYKFFLCCEDKWDGVGYSYFFDIVYNIWIIICILFKDLILVFCVKVVENV